MPHFIWNNHQIFYREQGEGPLLLILPGNTVSSICHQGELEYFSDHYHTASLDFSGTGKSDRVAIWAQDWWADGANQAITLVEHLGYQECIVMGTSGGAVAIAARQDNTKIINLIVEIIVVLVLIILYKSTILKPDNS